MYCSVDDLRTGIQTIRLIEATDDAHPNKAGEINVAIVEEMIELACGVIDGYIGGRVTLPLATVPVIIRKIAVDLSLYNVYERVGKAIKDSPIDRRRDGAMDLLRDIQNKKLSLGISSVDATPIAPTTSGAMIRTGRPEFTMDSMASLGGYR